MFISNKKESRYARFSTVGGLRKQHLPIRYIKNFSIPDPNSSIEKFSRFYKTADSNKYNSVTQSPTQIKPKDKLRPIKDTFSLNAKNRNAIPCSYSI